MLQEILARMPLVLTSLPLSLLFGATAAGVVLSIGGARYSRSLITLAAVGGGTILGLHAPGWFGLKVDGIGAAFCGAIGGGAAGFIFHRFVVGLLLASLLASIAGGFTWIMRGAPIAWTAPVIDPSTSVPVILSQIWKSLPDGLNPALPIALLVGLSLGTLLAVLWPRLSRVTFYGLLGTLTMTLFGALAVQQLNPQWLNRLPNDTAIELAIFAGIVVVSMIVQWVLLPKLTGAASSQKDADGAADEADALLFPSPSFARSAFPIDQKRQETSSRRQRVVATQS